MTKVLLASAAIAVAAGCGSMPSGAGPDQEVNTRHVGAVERAADEAGVDVLWVNAPRKRGTSE